MSLSCAHNVSSITSSACLTQRNTPCRSFLSAMLLVLCYSIYVMMTAASSFKQMSDLYQ